MKSKFGMIFLGCPPKVTSKLVDIFEDGKVQIQDDRGHIITFEGYEFADLIHKLQEKQVITIRY